LAIADVNGDERMDVLTGPTGQVTPGVYRGTDWYQNLGGTPPAFRQQVVSLWPYRGQISTADLNGDGRLDVLLGFSWFENRGGEPTIFTANLLAQDFQPTWGDYGEVAVGDLNNDGHVDAVSYNPELFASDSSLYAFLNDGRPSPGFAMIRIGAEHVSPAIGDLDGDGNPDIVCNDGDKSLVLYRNLMPPQPVTVLAPNDAGRVYASGGAMDIHWRTDLETAGPAVRLELWRGIQAKMAGLGTSWNPEGRGHERVTLPAVPTGGDYRIRAVSDWAPALYWDFNDEPFVVRALPSAIEAATWTLYR
jgi:hypothetical protein